MNSSYFLIFNRHSWFLTGLLLFFALTDAGAQIPIDLLPLPSLDNLMEAQPLPLNTIMLNPQPVPIGGEEIKAGEYTRQAEAGRNLTFRIAQRCREILVSTTTLKVQLTHQEKDTPPSLEECLRNINNGECLALVCLRLESSPYSGNSGYRIFVSHNLPKNVPRIMNNKDSVLPDASESYSAQQVSSLQLARFLDAELLQNGWRSASGKIQHAPLYLLKNSTAPCVYITLGYWTNKQDRNWLNNDSRVESAAQSLSHALLQFNQWLQESSSEGLK